MKNKYYNDALIGNENIVVSFNSKGELLRLYYPTRDYRQFIDEIICGIKINKSMLIKLNNDSNNKYEQYYSKKTNVLNTSITNKTNQTSITNHTKKNNKHNQIESHQKEPNQNKHKPPQRIKPPNILNH